MMRFGFPCRGPMTMVIVAAALVFAAAQDLVQKLNYAGNEAARHYLDGGMTAEAALRWLETYSLMEPARARQRLRFIGQYRSYVINYNLGLDLVRKYIEERGGTAQNPELRWREFARLLSSPVGVE